MMRTKWWQSTSWTKSLPGIDRHIILRYWGVRWTKHDIFIYIISFTKTDKNGVLFRMGNFIHKNLTKM